MKFAKATILKGGKTMKFAKLLVLALVFAMFLGIGPAMATNADSTATFTITLNSNCVIDTINNLTVAYDGLTDQTSTSSVAVTCSNGLTNIITVGAGANASGEVRRVVNGSNFLKYRFFKEAGMSTELGATTNNTISGTGDGTSKTTTLYAAVKVADNSGALPTTATTYTDTVSIAISW
jgi:spore coat protein U-like protein